MLRIRFGSPLISFQRLIKRVGRGGYPLGGGVSIQGGRHVQGVSIQLVSTQRGVSTWGKYLEGMSTQGWALGWLPWVSTSGGWVPRGVGEFLGVSIQWGVYLRGWYSPRYWHLVAATKTSTVGKWGAYMLLECFFLFCIFSFVRIRWNIWRVKNMPIKNIAISVKKRFLKKSDCAGRGKWVKNVSPGRSFSYNHKERAAIAFA